MPEDGAAASWWEDPQVCPSFGSKHDVVADPPCKGTPAVLLRTHPGLRGGTHREPERGCDGAALFLMKSSSRGSAALGSKKVVTSGSGFSGSGCSLAFLFTLR